MKRLALLLILGLSLSAVALFAPANVHFGAEAQNGGELLFKMATGDYPILAGKPHDGVNALQTQRVGDDQFEPKPVGLARQFTLRHWLHSEKWLENEAFEVDVLAIVDDLKRSLPGVNTSKCLPRVGLTGTASSPVNGSLRYFGTDNRSRDAPFSCQNGHVSLRLPGENLSCAGAHRDVHRCFATRVFSRTLYHSTYGQSRQESMT